MRHALVAEADNFVLLRTQKRYRQAERDVQRISVRCLFISATTINVNIFTEEQCLLLFALERGISGLCVTWLRGRQVRRKDFGTNVVRSERRASCEGS